MKKGSELVWSMCECESRIVCTATCCCTVSTCDSDPASSAIEPFKRRQVILHSRLSPPNPPSTLRRIVALQCTAQGDDVTRKGRGPRASAGPGQSAAGGRDQKRVPIQKALR